MNVYGNWIELVANKTFVIKEKIKNKYGLTLYYVDKISEGKTIPVRENNINRYEPYIKQGFLSIRESIEA